MVSPRPLIAVGELKTAQVQFGSMESQVQALTTQLEEAVNGVAITIANVTNHGLVTASGAQHGRNQNNTGDLGENASVEDPTLKANCILFI